MFLSRVLDTGDTKALTRHGIDGELLATDPEKEALAYIEQYAQANGGKAPDLSTVVARVPEFEYVPGVQEDFAWLAGELKADAACRMYGEQLPRIWEQAYANARSKNDPEIFENSLRQMLESVRMKTYVRTKVGTSIKTEHERFLAEYYKRKAGESHRIWPSHFPRINDEIGGYASSNLYTWFGRTGRGKSVIVLEEAIEAAMHGATVLLWSMEMGWYEVMVRIYTSISGREGLIANDRVGDRAGFDSRLLRQGRMNDEFERGFETFLQTIHEIVPGNIVIRAVDHDDFNRRDLRQLEADIAECEADVIVLDPFYYLDYERNTSKTTGGDAAETSKKLRRLAGRTQTVIHAITQADEDAKEGQGDERELNLPKRADVKKTKQLLEDAANLFAIDTVNTEGRGMIGLGKGRDGGEGASFEITYLPQFGVVREPDMSNPKVAAEKYGF